MSPLQSIGPTDSDRDVTEVTYQKRDKENDKEEVTIAGAEVVAALLVCVYVYMAVDAMNLFWCFLLTSNPSLMPLSSCSGNGATEIFPSPHKACWALKSV